MGFGWSWSCSSGPSHSGSNGSLNASCGYFPVPECITGTDRISVLVQSLSTSSTAWEFQRRKRNSGSQAEPSFCRLKCSDGTRKTQLGLKSQLSPFELATLYSTKLHSESKIKMPLCWFYHKCHKFPAVLSYIMAEASLAHCVKFLFLHIRETAKWCFM